MSLYVIATCVIIITFCVILIKHYNYDLPKHEFVFICGGNGKKKGKYADTV